MIFFIIGLCELTVIIKLLHSLKRVKHLHIRKPCGQCLQHAAYERLCERRKILGEAYRQHEELPQLLYASHRKREIAKTACQHFYVNLRNTFGQM